MAERVEKRRKIAPRAFGLADLPPDIVIRIAAKLDLTPDIRNFSSSCANTRDCLGAEAWTDLISRKFGDFNIKHPFPSWFPHFLWSDLTLRQRHVYCLMRAYDYKNSPKMSRENFERVLREYDGARAYVFAYTGSFKAVVPGTYDVVYKISFGERRRIRTSVCIRVAEDPAEECLWTHSYDGHIMRRVCPGEESTGAMTFSSCLRIGTRSDVEVEIVDQSHNFYGGDFDFSVKLRKQAL